MIKRMAPAVAVVLLGLFGLVLPAPAQAATPTGCTTSTQWIQQGSDYFYGQGNVTCTGGSYRAKAECKNQQTGAQYVKYGTQVASAPATASVVCNTGNVAEKVAAVADPLGSGITGCMYWANWIQQGSNYFYGQASVQCDTGSYRIRISCHNQQTGQDYYVYGSTTVTAPNVTTALCNTGNVVADATGV